MLQGPSASSMPLSATAAAGNLSLIKILCSKLGVLRSGSVKSTVESEVRTSTEYGVSYGVHGRLFSNPFHRSFHDRTLLFPALAPLGRPEIVAFLQ